MTVICTKIPKAVTLIELMIAMTIVTIASLGGLSYQYYAAKQSRMAFAQTNATRIAQLLLEDWRSTGGDTVSYNPVNLQLGFSSAPIPTGFDMGLSLGSVLNNVVYSITINGVPMTIMLSWDDVEQDTTAGTTLRQLQALVRWQQGYVLESGGTTLCNSPVVMTTAYIRLDAEGG
jgi:prepilin-type N-terminal cleavage/methylation domain-containing protein